MTVSIKDIAQIAGVSHSTVSRALADSSLVNPGTKARIRTLAQELGYSPDAGARGLVLGRTRTVGVVVTIITDPFIAEVVQGIETAAYAAGYSVILTSSNSEPKRELAAVEILRSKRVDAVIVTSSRIGALYQNYLERLGAPVVLVNTHSAQSGHYTMAVTVDNRHGGYLATTHLVELGHQRIAYVTGMADHSDDLERMNGYRQALTQAGFEPDPTLIVPGTGRANGGERALSVLMRLFPPPTAVFCYNDMTAIGLLRAAKAAGLAVPADLAIVGFDDIPFASYVCPPLTTYCQPKFELGQRAVEMALRLMDGPAEGVGDVVLQGQLVVRESTNLLCTRRTQ
jgi:DNA-binding LacI/PurR family transcriptional regulator